MIKTCTTQTTLSTDPRITVERDWNQILKDISFL